MSEITLVIDLNDNDALKKAALMLMAATADGSPVLRQGERVTTEPAAPPAAATEPAAPPAATTEPAAPPAATTELLDSRGMPWDERIHAKNKSKISDGTWRKKRGVEDELVVQAEAERRQTKPSIFDNPVYNPGAAPVAPPAPPAATTESAATAAPAAPAAPTAPAALAAPAAPAAGGSSIATFPEFMIALTEAGKTAEHIGPVLQAHGIPSLGMLAANQDKIPQIAVEIFGS